MTLPSTPILRRIAAAAATFLVVLGAPAAASAHSPHCPSHHGTLAHDEIGRIWHSGSSLLGCTVEYDHAAVTRRLGPWAPGTKVVFDGADVVWTVPRTVDGAVVDRVWGSNVHDGVRWLAGAKLVPHGAGQPFTDGRVYRLLQVGNQAAWITTTGDVVAAVDPRVDVRAVGTPPGPLHLVKQLLLVGSFPSASLSQLAASASFTEGDGEADDCGGSFPYTLTVQPDPSAPALGATWWSWWVDTDQTICGG